MQEITRLICQTKDCHSEGEKRVESINPPIHKASTLLFASYADLALANEGKYPGLTYGTDRLPAQRAFEEALCQLEGGEICRAFQSGINAIVHTLQAFTKAGDHIVVCDNVYWPTSNFCNKVLSKFGVEISYAPSAVGADIADYLRDNTSLIFMESPGSNTFEIQDIEAITQIARARDIVTILDGTWGTPLYHRALSFGVDVSIQSATKYISGHSDILLGTATVNHKYADILARYYQSLELFAPPADCYAALRGLKTLHVRLKHHEQSALQIADWLESQPQTGRIIHPARPDHPQHSRWKKYFTGSCGLFAFTFKKEPSEKELGEFINALQLFGIGYSWGGYKSLITAGKYVRNGSDLNGSTVIRLNIGLEAVEDLCHDLAQALARL
ncbi:cystathionine beta-lyase [Desulfotalea psychrophila]|uniref:Probable cystathionine beta-lyase n=1 Tax=Desulfotalea psychrophila (strain LSv54 / DSM 12343) TaxID=177439 RepID=Q6AJ03_DESPS|nr:cystathionine beta-lyase [Desulfotalea psychrophila]CAG37677.1 probable cystathionine beta-lyase [Desulfotalea psychrophila LSv54]